VRVVPCVLIVGVSLGLSGCAMFKKQPAPAPAAPDPLLQRSDRGEQPPTPPTNGGPTSPVIPTSASSGVLAGQVIDSYGRPAAEAYILVKFPAQNGEPEKKPIDVAANPQGYFTISGLRPAGHYQLTARARNGQRLLAGTTWATAPNPRVLIRISEDFVTQATPPLPPPPVWPERTVSNEADRARAAPKAPPRTSTPNDAGWGAARGRAEEPRTEKAPSAANQLPAIPIEAAPPDNTRIVKEKNTARIDPSQQPCRTPPVNQFRQPLPKQAVPNEAGPAASSVPRASRVPSCVLIGKQLVNFALYDLDDRVWEFRQRTGKLVLLDFWGTWCTHCMPPIAHLKILQNQYRGAGLQVIGIAYQRQGTPQEQRRQVDDFCQVKRINYKVLMGGPDCPVRNAFRVQAFPTLVLLDQNGWIVWQHEGGLDREDLKDLEMRIQSRLGVR
jgi:thiol-disulfide isomerase/thioredoxin